MQAVREITALRNINVHNYEPVLFSAVGIATRSGLDGQGIEFRWGARFSAPVQTGPGAHSASFPMGSGSIAGVKRTGRGVDHPPHLALRLKKE